MGLSNLPPGVTVGMIPGNRPEDVAEDAFWEALGDKLEKDKKWSLGKLEALGVDDTLIEAVTAARDLAYEQGYAEGRDEEKMAQGHREEQATEGSNDGDA